MDVEPSADNTLPMYEKLNGYLHDPKTGFQEWMFEDAMHEYLHRYFHPLFTREVQLDEN